MSGRLCITLMMVVMMMMMMMSLYSDGHKNDGHKP